MPDELGDEELKTLLDAARNKSSTSSGDALEGVPLAYDFKRPQRVNKEQIRAVENLHEQFARLFSSTLAASMRMVIDVDLAFVDQTLYGEFALSLSTPCAAYHFVMDPPGSQAVLCFAPELMMAIVDRALGGKGQSFTGDMRPLTQIERNIVNKLVSRLLADFEATWDAVTPVQITDVVLETNPEFIQIAASGEPIVLVAFEAHSNHTTGLIHLCYPLSTIEPFLPRLTPGNRQQNKHIPQGNSAANSHSLSKMQVSTVVQVAKGNLPLKEVAALKSGDVIKLDTHKNDPAVVFLGSQPKFLARPGLDGRRRAVQILAAIDASDEDLYR
ncbi:MAG: flagellar motor switch protein FliM [Candidatus Latescibacterota bacterium]|jgi:flagellar motor switch protein FliM